MEYINQVYPGYDLDKWCLPMHYLLLFYDESFERSYTIKVVQETLEHVAEIARTRFFV